MHLVVEWSTEKASLVIRAQDRIEGVLMCARVLKEGGARLRRESVRQPQG